MDDVDEQVVSQLHFLSEELALKVLTALLGWQRAVKGNQAIRGAMRTVLSSQWGRLRLRLLPRSDFPMKTQVADKVGVPCLIVCQPLLGLEAVLLFRRGQHSDSAPAVKAYGLFLAFKGTEHPSTVERLSLVGNERLGPLR